MYDDVLKTGPVIELEKLYVHDLRVESLVQRLESLLNSWMDSV